MLTKLTKNKKAKREMHERRANRLCDGPCAEKCFYDGISTHYANELYLDYYYGY
jgi:hypothetical protein